MTHTVSLLCWLSAELFEVLILMHRLHQPHTLLPALLADISAIMFSTQSPGSAADGSEPDSHGLLITS